jgi:hypothetical protein
MRDTKSSDVLPSEGNAFGEVKVRLSVVRVRTRPHPVLLDQMCEEDRQAFKEMSEQEYLERWAG